MHAHMHTYTDQVRTVGGEQSGEHQSVRQVQVEIHNPARCWDAACETLTRRNDPICIKALKGTEENIDLDFESLEKKMLRVLPGGHTVVLMLR